MRILLVGAGGVGTAFARIAARRPFAELVVADYDLGRAQRAARNNGMTKRGSVAFMSTSQPCSLSRALAACSSRASSRTAV